MSDLPEHADFEWRRMSAAQCHLDAWRCAPVGSPSPNILIVGEDNPISSDPENALVNYPVGCAGHRLQARILGLPEDVYLGLWRTNLCVGGWQLSAARSRAQELLDPDAPWATIILLGRKVAAGFRYRLPAFASEIRRLGDKWSGEPSNVRLISLPHPSGRNTLWNDHRAVTSARAFLRWHLPEIAWGQA